MKKNIRKEIFEKEVIPILKKSGLDVVEFNPGSFRISGDSETIDYHPRKGRLFYHNEKIWDTNLGTTKSLIELLSMSFDIVA